MEPKNTLAQRTLHWSSKRPVVRVSAPKRGRRGSEWHCWLSVELVHSKRVFHERVIGIDSWQSAQTAMWLAQKVIESKFPNAYAYDPGDGTGFPLIVRQILPPEYFELLRAHLETECARKTEELVQ